MNCGDLLTNFKFCWLPGSEHWQSSDTSHVEATSLNCIFETGDRTCDGTSNVLCTFVKNWSSWFTMTRVLAYTPVRLKGATWIKAKNIQSTLVGCTLFGQHIHFLGSASFASFVWNVIAFSVFLLMLAIHSVMELDTDGMAVLHALTQACSQNSLELKPAESQLKQWETSPGFYSILLVSHDLSHDFLSHMINPLFCRFAFAVYSIRP